MNWSHSFLLSADSSGVWCGLLLPICFKIWRVVNLEMLFCVLWLNWGVISVSVAFLSAKSHLAILLRSVVLTKPRELLFTGYFLLFGPLSVNPTHGRVGKSQLLLSHQVLLTMCTCLIYWGTDSLIIFVLAHRWTGMPSKVVVECMSSWGCSNAAIHHQD